MKRTLALFVPILLLLTCKQVDLTAPGGSSLTLTAQPQSINSNGVSSLTVIGTRSNGAPLPDGTVVRFTVNNNFGFINPNPVETTNGVATAEFRAALQSGTATIVAVSGGAESDSVDVVVGEARTENVLVTASPQTLPSRGGTSTILATVVDVDGNPVSGVQVFFTTDKGNLSSNGQAVVTNASGIARDVLRTTETAVVTATTATGKSGQITVNVNVGLPPECSFVFSPTTPNVGTPVIFTDTSTDPDGRIVRSTWNFGDGRTATGTTVTHVYQSEGTFNVVHTVVDNDGNTTVCTPQAVTVTSGSPTCDFVISPTSAVVGQDVAFTDLSTDDGNIVSSTWDFGDGDSASGFSVTHSYDEPGTFSVVHRVTDDQGNTSICVPATITISPA